MPIVSEIEKLFDKRYVLLRYSGVYDDEYIARDMVALMAVASREELRNLGALIVDLNAVSNVTMDNSDVSINNLSFRKMKMMVQQDRLAPQAAKRFFKRRLKKNKGDPRKIVTDKLRSYGLAHRELIPETSSVVLKHSHCCIQFVQPRSSFGFS